MSKHAIEYEVQYIDCCYCCTKTVDHDRMFDGRYSRKRLDPRSALESGDKATAEKSCGFLLNKGCFAF